jgi:ribonucleoside-diphosphate reductase alpha chain
MENNFDVWTNSFSENIFKQKYSLNKQEKWSDTCKRVTESVCGQLLSADDKDQIYKYMLERKFIPGGRYLYAAGRPFHQVNNCMIGTTRIITKDGIYSLIDLVDKDIEVLNRFGKWEPATVKGFGRQELFKITFQDGRTVISTINHRWWQLDGTRVTTNNLKTVPYAQPHSESVDEEGIRHGIIFGDGQLDTKTKSYSYIIISNPNKKELSNFFPDNDVAITGNGNSTVVYKTIRQIKAGLKIGLQPGHYKSLPSDKMTPAYARGFIAGLIATDGSTKTHNVTISCEGYDRAIQIAEIATLGGCVVTSVKISSTINPYNGNGRELTVISLIRDTVPLIRSDQIADVNSKTVKRQKFSLDVVSIEPFCKAETYCVVAPESESFTLSTGLITSNCFLFRAEDSREGWSDLMQKITASLMTGGGIGIDYSLLRPRGAKIHKTGGESTGPIALMHMVNEAGRYIMQGGSRRCLPTGSLVHTNYGLIPIEEIDTNKHLALTSDGYQKITNKFNQDKQDTITIKTQVGDFKCTPNHRMAVLTDLYGNYIWKEAQNLLPEDRLIFSAIPIEGSVTNLPKSTYVKSPYAYTAKEIVIPDLDADIAWFLGYFQGNGHCAIREEKKLGKRHGRVQVCVPGDAELLAYKILNILKRFGVNGSIRRGDGECYVVRVTSVALALYMLENVKQANTAFDVPKFILESTKEIRASYIAGILDADGSLSTRPINIMACIHKSFLEQLRTLCASLGFATRVKLTRKAINKWQNLYALDVVGSKQERVFYNLILSRTKYKKEAPRVRASEKFSYSFSPEMVRESSINKKTLHKNYKVNYPIENIESIIGETWFTPVQIKSIEVGERVQTYDIEVENKHEFFCNGFLTHNSAIWSGLSWQHGDIKEFINIKNWSEDIKKIKERDFTFPAPMEGTNISVIYDTEFFIAIENKSHPLNKLAKEIWTLNCLQAFKTAEPGMSFNFLKDNESLRNACTEVTSEDDSDKCNLGTVWMNRFDNREDFANCIKFATKFLMCGGIYSDVPTAKIREIGLQNNRIGLGLGGMHEWLMIRNEPYYVTHEMHKWLNVYEHESDASAFITSRELGVSKPKGVRAIAPTGTIGILAETTTGIEPLFCKAYKRRYLKGEVWHYEYVVDASVKRMKDAGVDINSIQDAYDLTFKDRVKFQADVQNYVDMSISSTCNLPPWGSEFNNEEILEKNSKVLLKYAKRLRGFTCYPDGSRGGQPLTRVELGEALSNEGVVFEEREHECIGGVCGV